MNEHVTLMLYHGIRAAAYEDVGYGKANLTGMCGILREEWNGCQSCWSHEWNDA